LKAKEKHKQFKRYKKYLGLNPQLKNVLIPDIIHRPVFSSQT
jgi:hypothetical protein